MRTRTIPCLGLLLFLFLLIPGERAAATHAQVFHRLAAALHQEPPAAEPTPYLTQEKPLGATVTARSGKTSPTLTPHGEPETGLLSLLSSPFVLVTTTAASPHGSRPSLVASPTREGRATRAPPFPTFSALSLAREPLR